MTKTEINKRVASMSPELIARVRSLIADGYGAYSITFETTATLKQANAVFALCREERSAQHELKIAEEVKTYASEQNCSFDDALRDVNDAYAQGAAEEADARRSGDWDYGRE